MAHLRPGELAEELGLSVQRVRQLAAAGRIPSTVTPGGHRRFDLAAVRAALDTGGPTWSRRDQLEGLEEDQVWRELRTHVEAGAEATRILQYAVTEMVNNAIDHSAGTTVLTELKHLGSDVRVTVTDDGVGVFERVRTQFDLPDVLAAIGELTKGKRTSQPERHSGEGIFFTSKAVDRFELAANGIEWTVDNVRQDMAVGVSSVSHGTRAQLTIDGMTDRDLTAVFRAFTRDLEFVRSAPVIRLFELDSDFVSRSEAKRLAAGLESFSEVVLDFDGVDAVGQGFVDELFRVWQADHPDVSLDSVNMNEAVAFMVARGRDGRDA